MSDSTENTKDLDSYGVWVKRPPQDASENDLISETLPDFSDIENTANEETSQENPIVTDEFNLDSLDLNETSISDNELSDISKDMEENTKNSTEDKTPMEAEDFSASFDDGEISLDDFMDGGFTDPNPGAAPEENKSSSDSIDFGGDGEISLDDFLDEPSESTNKADDVTNDEPLDIDLAFTESDEVPTEEIQAEDDNSDSFDDNGEYDDMFDELDNSNTENKTEPSFDDSKTEELSLDDFGIDDSSDDATAVAAGAAVNASANTEEVDLSDFGVDSSAEETPVQQDVQGAKKGQVVDYDLAVTEEEATSTAPTVTEIKTTDAPAESENEEPAKSEETSSVSNKLLEQIIADLSGLKNEINSLKGQFEELKAKDTIAACEKTEETISTEEEPKIVSEEQTGFFNDSDDDETIALSGAELDNIMNTADIAEEDAKTSGEEEAEEELAEPEVLPEKGGEQEEQTEEPFTNPAEISDTIENPNEDVKEIPIENIESEEDSGNETIVKEESIPDSEDAADDAEIPQVDANTEEPLQEAEEEVSDVKEEPTPAAEEINATFSDDNPFAEIGESPVEIPEEEHDSGLSLDAEENLEEPNLDNIAEQDIEDEISIPKTDEIVSDEPNNDILVESSSKDFMSSVNDATEILDTPTEESQTVEEIDSVEEIPSVEEIAEVAETPQNTLQEPASSEEETRTENTYFEEDTSSDPLTDENIDYLKDEDAAESAEDAQTIEPAEEVPEAREEVKSEDSNSLPSDLREDVKSVLQYMDQLLENLPEDKIMEFAKSEQFTTYKKLFKELGLS